jgi:hypothetical protein
MKESDRKIAELQGWTLRPARRGELCKLDKLDPTFNDDTDTLVWADADGKLMRFERTFQPSKTIGQAIELLEGNEEWQLTKGSIYSTEPFMCQISTWVDCDGESHGPWALGQTPAEAICRAFITYKEKRKDI